MGWDGVGCLKISYLDLHTNVYKCVTPRIEKVQTFLRGNIRVIHFGNFMTLKKMT